MTDEQIWLLVFGKGWQPYEKIAEAGGEIPNVFSRMSAAGMLEGDPSTYQIRLRPEKPNESIRVHVAPPTGVHTIRSSEDNSRVLDGSP
jgi:hypothetical protein